MTDRKTSSDQIKINKKKIVEKYPLLFKNDNNKIEERYNLAWKQVRHIAQILKKNYGATRVLVFGSLTDKNKFSKNSDIDLAVKGIEDRVFYKVYSEITRKYTDFDIDLVDIKDCRKSLLKKIEKEGIQV